MKTVEDCIEILAGMQERNGEFKLERSDYNLVTSLARQTFKGIGYTDRQHQLAQEKVLHYRQQFEDNGYDIDLALCELRIELRKIDRSRWVKIIESDAAVRPLTPTDDGQWIAVRFIFQKKLIANIDRLKRSIGEGTYDKENKVHYFPLNEKTVYEIVSNFNEENNFEVDEELKNYYEKLVDMENNKKNYLPGIYGLKLRNLHEKSLDYAVSSIGEPDIDNLCHFYDQKEKFGLYHFDEEDLEISLNSLSPIAKKVAIRKKKQVLLSSKEHNVNTLAEIVLELYRFPLLVVLNEKNCYNEIVQIHKAFSGIILDESCSVLFRLDNNEEGTGFNQYIKRNNLNNKVDKDTKIVYISSNKIPKPLLQSEWFPSAAITTFSGRNYGGTKVDDYLDEVDLIIHYDDEVSPWKAKNIEKL